MASATDWGSLYRGNATAVAALVGELTPAQLATPVPASPGWTAHEVVAHLAGGAADSVTGRMAGAPAPEWTARHVGERRHLPVAGLVEELLSHQGAVIVSVVDNPRPAIVWDIAVHHADLHEAFGLGEPAERLWRPVLEAVAPMMLGPVGGTVDGVAPYELFRGLFSRRSRTQMLAWGLPLSSEQLDGICVFGPRDDDQPVP
ncbi:maleylpyruvate isomerase N-terminal domain-containing protein [Nocardioides sp. W7]|uniref:maleylpyruvate isomerase N-terminal domain-containing protein n=1 Tax=Nocardioides sp. W7 TaxID=2931390 RepID=UPI001FD0A6CE|nr:maleylpyruvate isomerase N-terminal domain-containing protein [Nocardioides sp. W7]